MQTILLILRPHKERGGYHTDRFEAHLGDELISTHRSGWHTPARELLRRGYPPATLMRVQHAGRLFDPTIVAKPIGEIAKWSIVERDRSGLSRERWQPKPGDPLVAMYPDLWTEPSEWPWGGRQSPSQGGRSVPDAAAALPVDAATAAQLAFHLRGEQPAEAARLLKQVLPRIYEYVRRTHTHDEAAEFTARFADTVVVNFTSPKVA